MHLELIELNDLSVRPSHCPFRFSPLNIDYFSAALRYAVHDSLVTAAFSGLFLLKMANLFPGELDLNTIAVQVEQLASLLSEVAAERYALTLRLMLANLRRKVGMSSGGVTPMSGDMMSAAPPFLDPSLVTVPPVPPPFTMEELGVPWPHSQAIFSPSSIPVWLQDQVSDKFPKYIR